MEASFVDLRRKSAAILRAIERNERVTLFYRGRPKATIQPIESGTAPTMSAKDHPAFGMWSDREDMKDVAAYVRSIRRGRFDAV